ncbi:protein-tyrosine phosphatase family protein [Mangrovicoccus algicola]|uniref:Tyrosine specific protein phosphatases domain-containing protein n=1 Tax=Mangrovicoccus algicola TaxID=2771008 RepID=A0A8J6YWQ1_9RHOB|nr:hypothetical protein [Mangrovicoccus algicola]MBE3640578.1 hypothetical protein [Mangrovicoccus algicola]
MGMIEPEKYSPQQRRQLMDLETSIRTEIAAPRGGRIVTMGFPGLAFGIDGGAYLDPARMAATLDHPVLSRCGLLAVLVEPGEMPGGALAALETACTARGTGFAHLPIEDYSVPGPGFRAGWAQIESRVARILEDGGTLGLSCHYGAGRSGLIAAGLLIDQGLSAEAALEVLRGQFPDSVESAAQLDWLAARARDRAAAALRPA